MVIVNHVPELIAAKFGGADRVNLKDVERGTGLTYATVAGWAKGRIERADFTVLAVWCKYLGVGVGAILEYKADGE